MYISVHKFTPH